MYEQIHPLGVCMKIYLVTKRAKPTCKQLVLVAKYILKPTVLFFQVPPIPIGPSSYTNFSPESQVMQRLHNKPSPFAEPQFRNLHMKDQGCPAYGMTDRHSNNYQR